MVGTNYISFAKVILDGRERKGNSAKRIKKRKLYLRKVTAVVKRDDRGLGHSIVWNETIRGRRPWDLGDRCNLSLRGGGIGVHPAYFGTPDRSHL